jgi:penicillin-binding protein 1C
MKALASRGRRARRLRITLGAGAILALCLTVGWRLYRGGAGEPSSRLSDRWQEGCRVLDREGHLLRDLPSEAGQRGRSLPLDQIGERLILATLVSEDKSFYEHGGVDTGAMARAMSQNVRHGRLVSGASTITQQLVKLLDNGGQPRRRGLAEKLRGAARAQNLEQVMSKEGLLEAYLNRLSYGRGLVGPEAAAQSYFGVAARDLSWAQAAYLAVLPRAPSFLDPYNHRERGLLRQRALIDALHAEGALGHADHARAKAEPIALRPLSRPFLAPHFVESLRSERLLEGSEVRTTLDLDLQQDIEGLVRTHVAAVADKGADDAAVIVVDNTSGDVLAYVGSADFHDDGIAGQVDMVRALRQPGSTLKPFVYALAFARGHDGAEMLADVPATFSEGGRGVYSPSNFDGGFEGPISAREALAGSLNVPVIRLAAELPPGDLLRSLQQIGFTSLDRDAAHYGLSLALGSGEVTLRELAAAYVALARGGETVALRVSRDAPAEPAGARVIDPGIAALLAEILSDPLARVRGLHGQGPFDLGFPVAVKTGTSSGFRDTWSVGFTRERTVAVWVGNADGSPTRGLTGATGAGPLFADAMRRAMLDAPKRAPLWDEGLLASVDVCPLSGKPRGPACPDHAARRFVKGHEPAHACDLHVKVSPRPEARAGDAPWRCDPSGSRSIAVLPEVFGPWLSAQAPGAPGRDSFGVPWFVRGSVLDCAEAGGRPPEIVIDRPSAGSVFLLARHDPAADQGIDLAASVVGGARPASVDFLLDGRIVARSAWPYRAQIPVTPGDHEVTALPSDPSHAIVIRTSRFSVR